MRIARPATPVLFAFVLAACGGGNGGDATAPASQPLAVSPSLGKVQGGLVEVRTLAGSLIGVGTLGTAGSVDLPLPAGNAGVVVRLEGGDGVYYFDEGLGAVRALPAGRALHAVSAGARRHVTVSALTELVYRRALALAGGGPLKPALIAEAEASVRTVFGLAADGDLLAPPDVVDDPLDQPGADTWAGRQARLLAALSQLALERRLLADPDCSSDSACAPLLDLIDDLANDLADGELDGSPAGTSPGAPFYTVDGAATATTLRAALADAGTALDARIDAVRAAVADTDALIGDRLAGDYALDCQQTLPSASITTVAMHLTVSPDGGFLLRGPFGLVPLAAGSSVALVSEDADSLRFARSGVHVAPATATLAGSRPVADGLVISIPPTQEPLDPLLSQRAEVELNTSGPSIVSLYQEEWECTGFVPPPRPAADADADADAGVLLENAARQGAWLPDGVYRCERDSDPAQAAYLHASAGVLASWDDTGLNSIIYINSLEGTAIDGDGVAISGTRLDQIQFGDTSLPTLALARLPEAAELRDYPLMNQSLPDYGHAHAGDDIAATVAPRASLRLQAPDTGGGAYRFTAYRSLVTGKGYFDLTLGDVELAHCQAYTPPPPLP